MKSIKIFGSVVLAMIILTFPSSGQLRLNGAGATFPYVIYSKWFDVYHKKTGIQFNYQSIGSGGGIKQVIEGTVDFGATDAPMSDEQLKEAKAKRGTEILHIPTVMGAVVVNYNLPEVGGELRLAADAVAGIFLGEITRWNDPRITATNEGKNLPNKTIIVVHRSDGSGTTSIFTDYLSKVSTKWEQKVGRGTSVSWPVGLGGKGNEGVAGVVKQSPGSVGYVELAYAVKNKQPYAILKNKAGSFVDANFEAVSAAAAGMAGKMPADLRVSITDAEGKASYPISGFTWLLVYENMNNKEKANAIVNFLRWALSDGQSYAKELYYAPLPKEVVAMCEKKTASIALN